MIAGFLFIVFGLSGTVYMWNYISSDTRYTYNFPLTSHESIMLVLFALFLVMLIIGIMTVIFSVIKKNNQDTLSRIENIGQNGHIKGICPHCGLNIPAETTECPKCGYKINKDKNDNPQLNK